MAAKNVARDQAIFRDYALGASVPVLAMAHSLTENRVYQIIAAQRALVPHRTADDLRMDLTVQLNELRAAAHEIALSGPLPVHAPKSAVLVPEGSEDILTPVIGADYSGQLTAMRTIERIAQRIAKMYGLDTEKVETSGTVRYELVGVDTDEL
jgi:hypothetical protein